MLLAEREDDAVVGRRRLQLEVEGHAEALAQRQPERAVDAPAERRVQHELHAAGFVEEALGDDRLQGRHRAEDRHGLGDVADDLLGAAVIDAALVRTSHPAAPRGIVQSLGDLAAQIRDGGGQLRGARRRFAEPERDRRRRVLARPSTRTRPASTRRMRHERLPSRKMSPAMLSIAKSSLTLPTKLPVGSSTTS